MHIHGISIYAQSIVQIFEINKNGTGVSRDSTERLVTTAALARDTIYWYKCLYVAWYVCVSVSLLVTTHEKRHFYYRAMLCIRGTSHGPVSVCHKPVFY